PAAVLLFHTLYGHPTIYYLISHTVMNIGIALCLHWCVTHHTGKVGRILNSSPLVFIGVNSYSLYLWQQMILNRRSPSDFTQFPLTIILVVAASLVSYFVVEQPFLRLRQRLEKFLFTSSAKTEPLPASSGGPVIPESSA